MYKRRHKNKRRNRINALKEEERKKRCYLTQEEYDNFIANLVNKSCSAIIRK